MTHHRAHGTAPPATKAASARRPRPHRRSALALTGCGSNSPASSGSSGATQQIAITIKGAAITPKNKWVAVPVNKPITLSITSDRAGELHLHSSPEQHIEFKKGTTVRKFTLTVPSVVEPEEHQSETLVAQLEAR